MQPLTLTWCLYLNLSSRYSIKLGLKKIRAGKDREEKKEMLKQHCVTQYLLKTELKKSGKQGEAAVSKNLGSFIT